MGMQKFRKVNNSKNSDDDIEAIENTVNTNHIKVGFDPTLITAMKADHQRIMQLYTNIGILFHARQFNELKDELSILKTHLQAHLLVENVSFYNYLEQKLSDDTVNLEMIRDFRREMNVVAQNVVSFIQKFRIGHFTDDELKAFITEYKRVGQLLSERINREESNLHILYLT